MRIEFSILIGENGKKLIQCSIYLIGEMGFFLFMFHNFFIENLAQRPKLFNGWNPKLLLRKENKRIHS